MALFLKNNPGKMLLISSLLIAASACTGGGGGGGSAAPGDGAGGGSPVSEPPPLASPDVPPVVKNISPNTSGLGGGNEIVVKGDNFSVQTDVTVGDKPCENLDIKSANTLTCVIPKTDKAGTATVTVKSGESSAAAPQPVVYQTYVYSSNNSNGSISAYVQDPVSGEVTKVGDYPTSSSNPYGIIVDPSNQYVITATSSTVDVFKIDNTTGSLSLSSSAVAPSGGNQITASPDGNHIYATGFESDNKSNLVAYNFNSSTGNISQAGTYSAGSFANSVIVHPSGNFLYVSNTVSSDIIGFRVDQTSGQLTNLNISVNTSGAPDSISIDPSGKFLYSADTQTGTITTYVINSESGTINIKDSIVVVPDAAPAVAQQPVVIADAAPIVESSGGTSSMPAVETASAPTTPSSIAEPISAPAVVVAETASSPVVPSIPESIAAPIVEVAVDTTAPAASAPSIPESIAAPVVAAEVIKNPETRPSSPAAVTATPSIETVVNNTVLDLLKSEKQVIRENNREERRLARQNSKEENQLGKQNDQEEALFVQKQAEEMQKLIKDQAQAKEQIVQVQAKEKAALQSEEKSSISQLQSKQEQVLADLATAYQKQKAAVNMNKKNAAATLQKIEDSYKNNLASTTKKQSEAVAKLSASFEERASRLSDKHSIELANLEKNHSKTIANLEKSQAAAKANLAKKNQREEKSLDNQNNREERRLASVNNREDNVAIRTTNRAAIRGSQLNLSTEARKSLREQKKKLSSMGLAVSRASNTLYATDPSSGSVVAYDIKPDGTLVKSKVQPTAEVGSVGLSADASGEYLFTTDTVNNTVSVQRVLQVDKKTGKVSVAKGHGFKRVTKSRNKPTLLAVTK